jgi:hypothetical protein
VASWIEGDFNYDGFVDIIDAAAFTSTGLFNAGSYNAAPGATVSIAPVPEPQALLPWLCVAAAAMALRQRASAPRSAARRGASQSRVTR